MNAVQNVLWQRLNQACFPHCSGYGDLWDDIQNLQENDKDSTVHGLSAGSEEAEGGKEHSEIEKKDESSDWKSEEEENADDEDEEEEEEEEEYMKGTCICSCRHWLFCAVKFAVLWSSHTELGGDVLYFSQCQ